MENKKNSIIVMLGLLILIGQFCVVQFVSSTAQDRALAFIEDVLPIDSSKFFIELKSESVPDKPVFLTSQNISFGGNGDQVLVYFLASKMGTMDSLNVILAGRNNIVYQCAVDNLATGPNVGQSSLNEAATIFLTRYHNYSGLDSTEMIYMLSNIDFTQNASITLGDLTMIINPSGALTSIHWGFRDSARFDVSFQNNFPVSFYDERQISSNSTPTPIPTPTIPELQTWSIPLLLCVMMTFGLLVCHKKTKHNLVKKV